MANYWGTGRLGRHQSVAYTGTAGTVTNAFGDSIMKVRVVTTSAAFIKIGPSADLATTPAAATDVYMPADSPEYFSTMKGEKISAIQVSSGGTVHVTEIP